MASLPIPQLFRNATNITTKTTTTITLGAGVLHAVTINTKGASSSTIKLYDGVDATGTLLATIDATLSIGTLFYDYNFTLGLVVVTATGTAGDITVISS